MPIVFQEIHVKIVLRKNCIYLTFVGGSAAHLNDHLPKPFRTSDSDCLAPCWPRLALSLPWTFTPMWSLDFASEKVLRNKVLLSPVSICSAQKLQSMEPWTKTSETLSLSSKYFVQPMMESDTDSGTVWLSSVRNTHRLLCSLQSDLLVIR